MATFAYNGGPITLGGGTGTFPNQSGLFLCATSATSGGTQSNGVLLQYRGSRKLKTYRDATVWVPLGRDAPATEVGQYAFYGLDFSFSWPATGTDYDGTTSVTGATIETRIKAIVTALQSGSFVQVQDARGRNLIGSFTSDPEISDEAVGWRTVSASMVECR